MASPAVVTGRRRLARELLWSLVLLSVVALSLAAGTAMIAQLLRPRYAFAALQTRIGTATDDGKAETVKARP